MKRLLLIIFCIGIVNLLLNNVSYANNINLSLFSNEKVLFQSGSYTPYKYYAKHNIPISGNIHTIKQSSKTYIFGYFEYVPYDLKFYTSIYVENIYFSSQINTPLNYCLRNEKRGPPKF